MPQKIDGNEEVLQRLGRVIYAMRALDRLTQIVTLQDGVTHDRYVAT